MKNDDVMSEIPPREIILAKAGELFHHKGYGSVSVEEIIGASGLPKSAFYQHFPSKKDLGIFWLNRLIRRMAAMHRSFLERPGDRDRRLRKYFFAMLSWSETNGFRSCQFANTSASIGDGGDEMLLLIDKYKREQLKFFIEMVGTLVPQREATRLGTAVFLIFSGAMTESQNLKATWPFEDALACAEGICGVGVNHP